MMGAIDLLRTVSRLSLSTDRSRICLMGRCTMALAMGTGRKGAAVKYDVCRCELDAISGT